MGTQAEIYAVLGKRFPVERVDPNPQIDRDPTKLSYRLHDKKISIMDDLREEYDFLDGFMSTSHPLNLIQPTLGVKVLNVDHESGDRNLGRNVEALVGYAVAHEIYATSATALPSMDTLLSLRPRLAQDIKSQFGLEVPLQELELHLLYEFSQ